MEPGQLAIHHSYLLALAASGPWPGWTQGARRGSGAEGIDNKKAAVPLGNFKVPGAEIYVLKRLSQRPEDRSPYGYVSSTYGVPGAALGGSRGPAEISLRGQQPSPPHWVRLVTALVH